MLTNKTILGGLIVFMTLTTTVVVGQNRPEFSPEFWAQQKRLPDSLKGISPESLAVMARMNAAALESRQQKQQPAQPAQRAGGANLAASQQPSHVVQTGAFGPIRNAGGMLGKVANTVRPGPQQAALPPNMVQGPAVGVPGVQASASPPSMEVAGLLEQARVAKQKGDLQTARTAYRRILKIEPYNRQVLVHVGRVEHAMGELDNAIQAYQYLLRLEPNHAVALNDLGLCYARKGNLDAALKSLQAAVVAEPRSLRYRNNLTKVLIEKNDLDSAVKVLAQLRGDAVAKASVGAMLAQRGRNDEARAYLQQAIVADPNLTAARTKLAALESQRPEATVATRTEEMNPTPMTIKAGADDTQMTPPTLSIPPR